MIDACMRCWELFSLHEFQFSLAAHGCLHQFPSTRAVLFGVRALSSDLQNMRKNSEINNFLKSSSDSTKLLHNATGWELNDFFWIFIFALNAFPYHAHRARERLMIMKSKNANRFHYDSWDLDKCALEVDGEERERKEEAARKKWKTGSFLTWKSFNWVNPIICTNNSSAVLPTLLISWLDKAVLFTFSHEPRARMWKCWEFQNWLRERKNERNPLTHQLETAHSLTDESFVCSPAISHVNSLHFFFLPLSETFSVNNFMMSRKKFRRAGGGFSLAHCFEFLLHHLTTTRRTSLIGSSQREKENIYNRRWLLFCGNY